MAGPEIEGDWVTGWPDRKRPGLIAGKDDSECWRISHACWGRQFDSSRVPCDLGWCRHSWQIGLTGKTVTPNLYFAVGISGASHHMAGCGNARTIVAIKTDPAAAIFKEARFGIVGDHRKVVPALASAVLALEPNP